MPCDLPCSCFECPKMKYVAEKGEQVDIWMGYCPIATEQANEATAAGS